MKTNTSLSAPISFEFWAVLQGLQLQKSPTTCPQCLRLLSILLSGQASLLLVVIRALNPSPFPFYFTRFLSLLHHIRVPLFLLPLPSSSLTNAIFVGFASSIFIFCAVLMWFFQLWCGFSNYLFLVLGEWVFYGRHELQAKEKDDGSVAGKLCSILLNMGASWFKSIK